MEENTTNQEDWRLRDFWMGLLFLFVGIAALSIFTNLIRSNEPEALLVIAIGGSGWLCGPLFLLIGGNACFQSIRSCWK